MDCGSPGSSVHGILQARILEWLAISFSRGSSWPRDQTQVSCLAGKSFTIWATKENIQGTHTTQEQKYKNNNDNKNFKWPKDMNKRFSKEDIHGQQVYEKVLNIT